MARSPVSPARPADAGITPMAEDYDQPEEHTLYRGKIIGTAATLLITLSACGAVTPSAAPVDTVKPATSHGEIIGGPGGQTSAPSVDPYAGYRCNKVHEGSTWLCAGGWVVGVKMQKNVFGFAEAKGVAVRAFGDATTALVNVTLTRSGGDVAQMSGVVSHYSGRPQVFNLTGADSIDGGKYALSLNVSSY